MSSIQPPVDSAMVNSPNSLTSIMYSKDQLNHNSSTQHPNYQNLNNQCDIDLSTITAAMPDETSQKILESLKGSGFSLQNKDRYEK